ncbi:MAG: hypothetical protein SFU86_08425 [Pirellulaceae bacterium]|nr:hypothetical protein [Pirellulaceae bacterium]
MLARLLVAWIGAGSLFATGCCCWNGPCGAGSGCGLGVPTPVTWHSGYGGGPAAGHGGCAGCGSGSCGGACRGPACGPPCATCCFSIPKPIVWCGENNDCGPGGCDSCACPGDCGILPALRRGMSCGRGCGETYWGEWFSDPPDCCDPCDKCHGEWTGPHGFCNLGPAQRLLAAVHGFTYCPSPCGPCCGICHKPDCGGCGTCGSGGCATCGHGGGYAGGHGAVMEGPHSVLEENWDHAPGPKPVPGKPIHKAQQPKPQYTRQAAPRTAPSPTMPAANNRMVRTAGYQRR